MEKLSITDKILSFLGGAVSAVVLVYAVAASADAVRSSWDATAVHLSGGQTAAGAKTWSDNAVFNANTTLGDATGDTITFTGRIAGDVAFVAEANHSLSVPASTTASTAGGNLTIAGSAGSAGTGATAGATGGAMTTTAGSGGAGGTTGGGGTGGGSTWTCGGAGGAAGSTSGTPGAAGLCSITGGAGGTADGTSGMTGGVGANIEIIAGIGGTSTDSDDTAGAGGALTLRSGAGGAVTAGTGAASGNVVLDAGAASGAATAGTVTVCGANASTCSLGRSGLNTFVPGGMIVNEAVSLFGTYILFRGTQGIYNDSGNVILDDLFAFRQSAEGLTSNAGTAGSGATPGTAGIDYVLTSGVGGAGGTSGNGAVSGALAISTAAGGMSGTTTGTAGNGGALSITGGAGGAINGNLALTGGTGAAFAWTSGAGGATGGALSTAGTGGAVTLLSGAGGSVASGGTGAASGAFSLDVGAPTGSASAGALTIGNTNATAISIAGVGTTTDFEGAVQLVTAGRSVASGASATLNSTLWPAGTTTITGSTNITTAAGFNLVTLQTPTYSAASALTITNAATFYIADAPAGGGAGPATITNAYSAWVDAGAARFDGRVLQALGANITAAATITLGAGGNTFPITGATQINCIVSTGWTTGSKITLVGVEAGGAALGDNQACTTPDEALQIGAAFTFGINDTISFVLYNSEWVEISRSDN